MQLNSVVRNSHTQYVPHICQFLFVSFGSIVPHTKAGKSRVRAVIFGQIHKSTAQVDPRRERHLLCSGVSLLRREGRGQVQPPGGGDCRQSLLQQGWFIF